MAIHSTALVSKHARLGADVVVEPFAVIESNVEIGAGTLVGAHAVIRSRVRTGARNRISAHAVLGEPGQDLSYEGDDTWVEIGDDNVIREGVTIHRATRIDAPTRIGSGCFLMAYSHVGHDCEVGDNVVLTNNVCLGGHVSVGDYCTIGGGTLVHQFTRVGTHAMLAADLAIRKDVLPYCLIGGQPIRHYRLNAVGLRRHGIKTERYRVLERAFRALRAGEDIPEDPDTPEVAMLREWVAAPSRRGRYGFL